MKCEKDYGSISGLKSHFAEEQMGKCYTCDKCSKSFSSKYTLGNHIKIEHDQDRIKCERKLWCYLQKEGSIQSAFAEAWW